MWCAVFVLLCLLSGCGLALGGSEEDAEKTDPKAVSVVLPKDDVYDVLGGNTKTTEKNGEVTFRLRLKDDLKVKSVSRTGGEVENDIIENSDGTVDITVKNVPYSMFLNVECVSTTAFVTYHLNGGTFIDGTDTGSAYTVGYSLVNRLRPNTEIGNDRFYKTGFVLTGWNSEADGSGEHTGLGSRITVEEGSLKDVYAEWMKETDPASFVYNMYGDGWMIKGYTGTDRTVVIPRKIEGTEVKYIGDAAFSGNTTAETVVIPYSVKNVSDGAFAGAELSELFIYDNIEHISDKAFKGCENLKTVHINAFEKPRFSNTLYSEYSFADKYDILMLNKDKKKVVVFGGSGAYFSLVPKLLEEELTNAGEDYICINMAVNGWFNGAAQFDMISAYLNDGDIFIHAPETSSGYSFMYDVSMTPWGTGFDYNKYRLYYCTESNYDLLSLVDLRGVTDFFDGFNGFNELRQDMPEKNYTDYKTKVRWYGVAYDLAFGYIDDRGGVVLPKNALSSTETGEADIVVEYVTDKTAISRLNAYYDAFNERGITVLFTTAPINGDTLKLRLLDPTAFYTNSNDGSLYYGRRPGMRGPAYKNLEDWVSDFEKKAEENLHAKILVPLSENIYKTEDFFEPDYHLADGPDSEYTEKIAEALKAFLQKE